MILIDTNSLIILILGLIDPKIINNHPRTSIYEEHDFFTLINLIENNLTKIMVLPNIWTEVDNLLNNFRGDRKWAYIQNFKELTNQTSERYLTSMFGANHWHFIDLGLTDALILECAKECELLITSDSKLSDLAIANGIKVVDLVKERNKRLK
jgi:rRNA-processing protein FCF1